MPCVAAAPRGFLVYGCMARLTEDRARQLSWMIEAYGSF